jgi:hypothetical protein
MTSLWKSRPGDEEGNQQENKSKRIAAGHQETDSRGAKGYLGSMARIGGISRRL